MATIGYARVSTPDQSLDRQLDELRDHGCERIFGEAASGKRGAHRPQWEACVAHLRAGDTLVVVELSRLGRNTGDLGRLLDHLDERDIALRILHLGIDTRTPAGRLIFTIVGAVSAMERDLLIERTQSGLAAARARGRVGGRRRGFTETQAREAQRLYNLGQLTVDQIARAIGSSSSTVYRYLNVNEPREYQSTRYPRRRRLRAEGELEYLVSARTPAGAAASFLAYRAVAAGHCGRLGAAWRWVANGRFVRSFSG